MSNAVDILLIDGPAHAVIICAPRPVTNTYDINGARYLHREHVYYGTEQRYHVAVLEDSIVSDDYIDGTIFILNFKPAWDLDQP